MLKKCQGGRGPCEHSEKASVWSESLGQDVKLQQAFALHKACLCHVNLGKFFLVLKGWPLDDRFSISMRMLEPA